MRALHVRSLVSLVCLGMVTLTPLACGDEDPVVPPEASDASVGSDTGPGPGPGPGNDGSAGGEDGSPGADGGKDGSAGDAALDAGPPCGVEAGTQCPVGGVCKTSDDCEGLCTGGKCAAPTTTDGKLSPSLGETDVDCGGPTAKKCDEARMCKSDGDCASAACSTAKACVGGQSCKGSANGPSGIETCGKGETGAGGEVHESCCRSLPLPTRPTRRLDRYEITGGRLRAFIDAVTAANAGVPNVRAWAKAYAMAHPGSQLDEVLQGYPGLLDILPDHAGPNGATPLPVHLGAFPLDPINSLDGCYVGNDSYGHPTYWQPPADLKGYGIGNPVAGGTDGKRMYSREILDEKPVNCVMALMLASFCAWDGGELARTKDYREVWGRHPQAVGATTVYVPWNALLPVGDFNWRNGHGAACSPAAWPGCVNPQDNYFYQYPFAGHNPANDDTPAIAAPGRFMLDVTEITSASGDGWFDVGGNFMETAWPTAAVNPGANPVKDVCDVSSTPGPGETACTRRGVPGTLRYSGNLPHVALVGYSFEGHARRSENYLSNVAENELLIGAGDLKPVSFQYGKVGGRCAR
jgi:hypothetical protein